MKLLIIACIKDFESDVKDILLHAGVKAYSFHSAKGIKNEPNTSLVENWFVSQNQETDSLIFTVFIPQENVEKVENWVAKFNKKQETLSHVHVAILALDIFI